jgi:hypothetical protein
MEGAPEARFRPILTPAAALASAGVRRSGYSGPFLASTLMLTFSDPHFGHLGGFRPDGPDGPPSNWYAGPSFPQSPHLPSWRKPWTKSAAD